jgi:hypothetical protein
MCAAAGLCDPTVKLLQRYLGDPTVVENACAAINSMAQDVEVAERLGVCGVCDKYRGCARGLGDTIHAIASATGIANAVERIAGLDCGCAERRAALNAAVPFTDRSKES